MRVLTIGLLYPPQYLGGYELMCEGVMHEAQARGHEILALVSDYRAGGTCETATFEVDRSLRSYLDDTAQRVVPVGPLGSLRIERHNAAILERHLREFVPDVVSWWGMGGMSLSLIERVRRAGIPSVLAIHDHWLSYGPQVDAWSRMVRRFRLRPLAPLLEPLAGVPVAFKVTEAGRCVFNSRYTLERALAAGIEPADYTVITPGIHARYQEAEPRSRWDGRLLYAGRLDPDKGIDVAVAALAELPNDTTLQIVGAGKESYEDQLRREAAALGVQDRVQFSGPARSDVMPQVFASADAVLFVVRWDEPWGLVPLEAMAVGRPVIATARGGAATYLRDGENALVIPADDPRALAGAVRRLAESADLRASLRAGGFRTAAEHSASRHDQLVVDELERAAEHTP